MKRKRFTEAQIAFALRQADPGMSVFAILRNMQICETTFYRWKKKWAFQGCVGSSRSHLHRSYRSGVGHRDIKGVLIKSFTILSDLFFRKAGRKVQRGGVGEIRCDQD